jgi:hypothetical protein
MGGLLSAARAVRGRTPFEASWLASPLQLATSLLDPSPRAKLCPRDAPSPSGHPTAFLSGRQDLNLRPPSLANLPVRPMPRTEPRWNLGDAVADENPRKNAGLDQWAILGSNQ